MNKISFKSQLVTKLGWSGVGPSEGKDGYVTGTIQHVKVTIRDRLLDRLYSEDPDSLSALYTRILNSKEPGNSINL